MKKGVSAVIAIVLILMITVALAAMAYVFFTSVFTQISKGASESVSNVGTAVGTQLIIENVAGSGWPGWANITIRNVGTVNINLTKLSFYVDNTLMTDVHGNEGILSPGNYTEIDIETGSNSIPEPCGKTLKVTTETGFETTAPINC